MPRILIALAATLLLVAAAEPASGRTKIVEVERPTRADGQFAPFLDGCCNLPYLKALVRGRPLVWGANAKCRIVDATTKGPFLGRHCFQGVLASTSRFVQFNVDPGFSAKGDPEGGGFVTAAPLMGAPGSPGTVWRCSVGTRGEVKRARDPAVALSGDIVAVAGTPACEPSATIELHDASHLPPAPLPMATVQAPRPVRHLALAGTTLAYATTSGVGVVDGKTGRPLFAPILPAGLVPSSLAVRPDGTFAAVLLDPRRHGVCEGRSVWLFSAAVPGGRKLADRACDLKIAATGDSFVVNRLGPDRRVELDRVRMDGRVATLAALHIDPRAGEIPRLTEPRMYYSAKAAGFADTLGVVSDGSNVAFVQPDGCTASAHLYVQPVSEPAPRSDRVVPRCALNLGRIDRGQGRTARLRLGADTFDDYECETDKDACTFESVNATIACARACAGVVYWEAKREVADSRPFEIAAGRRLRIMVADTLCVGSRMRYRLTVITALGDRREIRGILRCH